MDWQDSGIVLAGRRFGESGLILDVLTRTRGKRSALVYGGASRKKRATLEIGNTLMLEWRGRLEDQLGHFSMVEIEDQRAAQLLDRPVALTALSAATGILQTALPENNAYEPLYNATTILLDSLTDDELWPAIFVKWEAGLLSLLGYGMDLTKCAVTGVEEGLTHVSPRTGRAVTAEAAEPYLDKLLRLPAFLVDSTAMPTPADIAAGFELTGYFLERRLYSHLQKPPPEARDLLLRRLESAELVEFTA